MKNISTCLVLATAMLAPAAHAQVLVAGWDFQTTTTGGTALASSDAAQPRVLNANFGSGTLYLDGSQGSSSWVSALTAARELNAFGGTTINASNGLSQTTSSPAALALVNSSANGKSAVFKLSLSGYTGLSISLAAQRTSSGFTSQVWEYSTDGVAYQSIGTLTSGTSSGTIANSFATSGILGFNSITCLDNAANAYVRVTFSGATGSAGNNRIDNIQFTAFAAVPETSTYAAITGLGLAGFSVARRLRRQQA